MYHLNADTLAVINNSLHRRLARALTAPPESNKFRLDIRSLANSDMNGSRDPPDRPPSLPRNCVGGFFRAYVCTTHTVY
jgi:hypothetical protein